MRKRAKRLLGLAVLGVVIAGATVTVTRVTQRDLRSAMAEYLRGDEDTVVLNLPPMPKRYPGSVLMSESLLPLNLVGPGESGLDRGPQFSMKAGTASLREASGGVAAEIFEEVTKSTDLVEFEWSLEDGRVVEMQGVPMMQRLAPYRADGDDFYVVTRSIEGRLKLSVRRKADAALDAYTNLQDRVKTSAGDASDAKVEISGKSSEDSRMEISLTVPTVVAFQLCKVADYKGPADVPAAVTAPRAGAPAGRSVDALLRVDPKLAPSVGEALRQIGPDADGAIVAAIERQSDPERIGRATQMLQRDPKPAGRTVARTRPATPESEQVERARKAAAAASDPTTSVASLAADLKPGGDRAVQLIALGALARRGTDAASAEREVAALLRHSTDSAVRTAAEHTLRRIRGEVTRKPPDR